MPKTTGRGLIWRDLGYNKLYYESVALVVTVFYCWGKCHMSGKMTFTQRLGNSAIISKQQAQKNTLREEPSDSQHAEIRSDFAFCAASG